MAAKPILYSYFRSSASWRVRTALALKGIDYEYRAVNLMKDGGEQHKAEYRGTNAFEQVPSLVIDNVTLTQSLPIIEYLDETRPGFNLLPKEAIKRAHARRIAEMVNSGIQPVQNLTVLNRIATLIGNDDIKAAWAKETIDTGLKAIEEELKRTAGKFCVGDEVTIADLTLVPQVYNAIRFKVDLTPFPTVERIYNECLKIEAFQAAHPSKQPDTPEEFRS